MARVTPPDRLERLLAIASAAFVEHGFQHTQMDDIALAMGVAKGTIYRSVDSKESLLAAVIEYADTPEALPVKRSSDAFDLARASKGLRQGLGRSVGRLALTAAARRDEATLDKSIGPEVQQLAADLFEMMARHRIRIMVLDRCATELPALAAEWHEAGRYSIVDLWVEYLSTNAEHVGSDVDVEILARTIVELITLWAVKMPWDPTPRSYGGDAALMCAEMVRDLVVGARP